MVIATVHDGLTAHPAMRAWSVFQQTYLLASRYFESVTSAFGVSFPQAAVLGVLRRHDQPLPLSQIARVLMQEAQSTTELADRLERRGYVRRMRDSRDRRLVLLELTSDGRAAIDALLPALEAAGEYLFDAAEPDGAASLEAAVALIRARAVERLGSGQGRVRPPSRLV